MSIITNYPICYDNIGAIAIINWIINCAAYRIVNCTVGTINMINADINSTLIGCSSYRTAWITGCKLVSQLNCIFPLWFALVLYNWIAEHRILRNCLCNTTIELGRHILFGADLCIVKLLLDLENGIIVILTAVINITIDIVTIRTNSRRNCFLSSIAKK